MADYDIYANITANTKGYEAGIKKAQESTKKFSTSLSKVIQGLGKNGLVGAMGSIGLASAGLSATLGAVVKIARNVSKAIDECTEAYKKQNIAEISLKTAMQNNPLTNGQGTKQLREFASEMQRTSNMGDEELIPFMTQLIASGRTEAETMQIIKTASDMASSGAMSFDTAVTQLNATLNGNIGRLGQQNAELKGLTEEELKNGKAVDILAEKYKGLTEATVDTKKQLQNAIGDLRESFGTVFEKALSPMRTYFAEIIQGWADARKAKQEYEGAVQAVTSGNADIEQLQIVIDANQKKLEDFNKVVEQKAKEYKKDREEILANWIMYLTSEEMEKYTSGDLFGPKQAQEIERQNTLLQGRIRVMKKVADAEEKVKQKRAEGEKAEAERLEREKQLAEMQDKYLKKIAEQEARWNNIESVTGETVKAEEKINFYQNAIVDTLSEANGQIDAGNELFEEQVKIIERLQAGLDPEQKKTGNEWEKKLREQLIARLEADKEEKLAEVENTKMASWQKEQVEVNYNEQLKKLKLEALEIEKQEALESVKDLANAEEERLRIQEYYENEKFNLILEYAKKNKEAGKVASDSFVDGFKTVTKKLAPIVNEIGKVLGRVANVAKTIGNVFKEIAGFMKSAFSQIKGTMGKLFKFDTNDALDSLLKFEDSILTFFVETLPQMPSFLASAFQSIEVLVDTLEKNIDFDFIFNQFAGVFGDIASRLPKLMSNISSLLNRLLTSLNNMLKGNMNGIVSSINNILNSFLQTLPQITNNIFSIFNTMLTGLQQLDWTTIFSNLGIEIQTFFDNLPTTLTNLIETLSEIIKGILDSNFIPTVFDGFGDAICEFLGNTDQLEIFLESLMTLIGKLAGSMLSNAGKIFGKLIEDLPEIIGVILKTLPDILADVIGGAFDGVVAILKGTANLLIKGINFVVDALNKADFLDLFSDIPHIPLLAKGTDNAPKGLAIVGEAGPELVNFRGGEQVLNNRNTQKALAGMGGNTNEFNVNFYNTKDTSAFALVSQFKQYNRELAINGII